MSEAQEFQVGAFVSPLTAATTNELLQDADPAIYHALGFYQAVVQAHLGARFDAEMTRVGTTFAQYVGKASSTGIPYDPSYFLTQAQLNPPFLALFTESEKFIERTRAYYQIEATWKLQWVLPPMTPAQTYQLGPFLRAFSKVITDRTIHGYDPSYQSGALFCELGGIAQLDLGPARFGAIPKVNTQLLFPAVEFELTCIERRMTTPNLQPATGLDGSIAVTDQGGANPVGTIDFQEDLS